MSGALSGASSSSVYLMTAGPYAKIGKADDVARRYDQLRTACPEPIVLTSTIECDSPDHAFEVERWLHHALATWNTHGEWFKPAPAVALYFMASPTTTWTKCEGLQIAEIAWGLEEHYLYAVGSRRMTLLLPPVGGIRFGAGVPEAIRALMRGRVRQLPTMCGWTCDDQDNVIGVWHSSPSGLVHLGFDGRNAWWSTARLLGRQRVLPLVRSPRRVDTMGHPKMAAIVRSGEVVR